MANDAAKNGMTAGHDPKTGRFVKGNTEGDKATRGRRHAEFTIQDILDDKLPEDRWWTDVLEPQVRKAMTGDTPAAALLLKARWGETLGIKVSGGLDPFIIELRQAIRAESNSASN